MVKMMKEAHEMMQAKHEEEISNLREKHASEFLKYEENIRYTLEKKVKNKLIFNSGIYEGNTLGK